jgi:hypothetical protein
MAIVNDENRGPQATPPGRRRAPRRRTRRAGAGAPRPRPPSRLDGLLFSMAVW